MSLIPILMYHSIDETGSVVSITPQLFSTHMEEIKRAGFNAVSLTEAVSFRKNNGQWPDKTVVLTFDDGFANVYETAGPILAAHGFTATVFVITEFMGRNNEWAEPPAHLGSQSILTWRQAAELAKAGLEIGSHTKTHPDLRRCSREQREEELAGSRKEIEDRLGLRVDSLAYPYGENDTATVEQAARHFSSACTTVLQEANGQPLHSLPRVDAYYLGGTTYLQRLLAGELTTYLAIRRFGRSARRVLRFGKN
jgi:peptidoglycan/xylan/chitin deacetylase (PgdA/CDA1 family)